MSTDASDPVIATGQPGEIEADTQVYPVGDDEALVPMDEIDVELDRDMGTCTHTFWTEDDRRLYALEPDPQTGYWLCCPLCALQRGQRNRGNIPRELRTL